MSRHLRTRTVKALRELGARPRLLPLTALVLRASTVRPASVFSARECRGRRGLGVYRLRENDLRVAIRHGTPDVVTLGEVFHDHHYRPTPEIEPHLTEVSRIVDLGANIGLFGVFAAARWPEAEILAFEPDPANAAVHERTIAVNGLGERWRLIRAAAGARDGQAAFVAGEIALSHLAQDGETAELALRTAGLRVRSLWHRDDGHGMLWAWRD
jgi:hypothetical protein